MVSLHVSLTRSRITLGINTPLGVFVKAFPERINLGRKVLTELGGTMPVGWGPGLEKTTGVATFVSGLPDSGLDSAFFFPPMLLPP